MGGAPRDARRGLTPDPAADRRRPGHGDVTLLLGGLGAATILAREAGLHILEVPDRSEGAPHAAQRVSVAVSTAPRPPGDPSRDSLGTARRALADQPAVPTVVRRYRFEPTPLFRDAVRGFRTGRVDRVLAGDFDLF